MSLTFFRHVDRTSWHHLENSVLLHLQVMIAKYFRIITYNWRCTHIFLTLNVLLQFMDVKFSIPVLWLQVYYICHLCMLHQQSDWWLLILYFGFSLIFISSSWSMYFLITSSDKITISSISSDTTAVVEGVVDNLLPKKFFKFKL